MRLDRFRTAEDDLVDLDGFGRVGAVKVLRLTSFTNAFNGCPSDWWLKTSRFMIATICTVLIECDQLGKEISAQSRSAKGRTVLVDNGT